jgi:aldose 1-epimerase
MSRSHRLLWLATAVLIAATGCQKPSSTPSPTSTPVAATPAEPTEVGGEQIVKLTRTATTHGQQPEFLSATILPGRGMNVFQITANVPGKGVIPILWSPSLSVAAQKLNGGPGDEFGNACFSFGGCFLIPYPNRIIGKVSPDGQTITTSWHGHTLVLPANFHNSENPNADKNSIHGLIEAAKTDDLQTQNTPDGQTLTGVIHAGDFGGHWLSKTDLDFTLALTGKALDIAITAKNIGNQEEPMSIGWHPYFVIPSGDRAQARLHVPGEQVALVNNYQAVFPTGKLIPVKGTRWDFTSPNGKALDGQYLDDNWSKLQRTNGAVDAFMEDPASNYGVRVLGLSPEIKTVQSYSPPSKNFVAIEEQFNFADPFGKEWHGRNTGMVTLKPGKSVTWHVRVELFTPNK